MSEHHLSWRCVNVLGYFCFWTRWDMINWRNIYFFERQFSFDWKCRVFHYEWSAFNRVCWQLILIACTYVCLVLFFFSRSWYKKYSLRYLVPRLHFLLSRLEMNNTNLVLKGHRLFRMNVHQKEHFLWETLLKISIMLSRYSLKSIFAVPFGN